LQVPYPSWQPELQYLSVIPQYPYLEQHDPNEDPVQVYPVPEPQAPDGETTKSELAFLGAAAAVAVDARRRILKRFTIMFDFAVKF